MNKYLDPFSDYGFKKLFGEDSSKDALIDFLNALLAEEGVHIAQIEYLPLAQLGPRPSDRITFFDLYCTDAEGRHFIVEIQQQSHKNFKERLVYYATYPIRRQAKKGDWAFELKPVYVIAILDFILDDDDDPDPVSIVKYVKVKRNRIFYDKLTFVYVEMPKFKKSGAHIDSTLEEWLFYLKKMANLTEAPSNLKNPAIMKFLKDAEIASLSEEEHSRYERSLRFHRDALLIQKSIQLDKEEAFKNGLAKGEARGRKKGRAEGRAEGEFRKALQTAEVLLRKRMSLDIVMEASGLNFDTVADLKNKLGL